MADVRLLFQGLTQDNDHETAVKELLSLPDIDRYALSVAYIRKSGVDAIRDELVRHATKIDIFAGIRNGITSIQAILSLLEIGIQPYVVDTATKSTIYHPKIYAGYNSSFAHVILGSANLTSSGLNRNIEASTIVRLDRNRTEDEKFVRDFLDALENMTSIHPDHVFQIHTAREAVKLLHESRLEDERTTRLPSYNEAISNKERDKLAPMRTYVKGRRKKRVGMPRKKRKLQHSKAILVWESKELTERALCIPKGPKTHAAGSMNFGKGRMLDIEQRHYFRDEVFANESWAYDLDPRYSHLERAHVDFEIIIKNISCGKFTLKLTHDTKIDSPTYREGNTMTRVHWGQAKDIIAKRDLLGRLLKLYKNHEGNFVIVID